MTINRRRLFALTAAFAASLTGDLMSAGNTPNWQAARNGLTGDPNAVDKAAQINQFLGTHANTTVYAGSAVVAPNYGTPGSYHYGIFPNYHMDTSDYDQPFTMSGASIGRVSIPLVPVGSGADLQVSLCADNAGAPGTVLNTVRIPAQWITSVAGIAALPAQSTYTPTEPEGDGALRLPQFNTMRLGTQGSVPWSSPAFVITPSGLYQAGATYDPVGGYLIEVGGYQSATAGSPSVYTTRWGGGSALEPAVPQGALPYGVVSPGVAVVDGDTVVTLGGFVANVESTNVVSASWDPGTGNIGAWSNQAALPVGLAGSAVAVWGSTLYVLGGQAAGVAVAPVYYATVQNGQITGWNTGPALPVAVANASAAVVGDMLYVVGGLENDGTTTPAVYYAVIYADGSLSSWQPGPSLPTAISNYNGSIGISSAGIVAQGQTSGGTEFPTQTLAIGPTGPGQWQEQNLLEVGVNGICSMFPLGAGQWQFFAFYTPNYGYATVYQVPYISVPLPTSGLTNGATYHILMQQQGGDLNNYLLTWLEDQALPGAPTAQHRTRGGGNWTSYNPGYAIPLSVYDQTPGGQPWHSWDDSGARISTLVYATTPDMRMLGGLESVLAPDGTPVASGWWAEYPGDATGEGFGVPGALFPVTKIHHL